MIVQGTLSGRSFGSEITLYKAEQTYGNQHSLMPAEQSEGGKAELCSLPDSRHSAARASGEVLPTLPGETKAAETKPTPFAVSKCASFPAMDNYLILQRSLRPAFSKNELLSSDGYSILARSLRPAASMDAGRDDILALALERRGPARGKQPNAVRQPSSKLFVSELTYITELSEHPDAGMPDEIHGRGSSGLVPFRESHSREDRRQCHSVFSFYACMGRGKY